jgi:hypothetical protein
MILTCMGNCQKHRSFFFEIDENGKPLGVVRGRVSTAFDGMEPKSEQGLGTRLFVKVTSLCFKKFAKKSQPSATPKRFAA